jgi:pimeloyl-ACP methyl ester carboxylesterase
MRIPRRTAAVLALSLALAPFVPAVTAAAGPSWIPCQGTNLDPRQECTTLRVPLDYRDPGGRRIDLAVSRVPAADPAKRRGVLVLIPGGPGNSGLDLPSTDGASLPRAVRDSYDLIGFDPRGVAKSSPVSCGLSPEDNGKLVPWPGPGGDISGNVARAHRVADACLRNGGDELRTISTRTEARDLDSIRKTLGENKISYWGTSYGTYVGAAYATLFPERTDRVLLDSNDDPDPDRVARGWLANYAIGIEDRFGDFAAWAAAPGNPSRLANTPDEVRPLFLRLAAKLDQDDPPQGSVLRQTLLNGLYNDKNFPVIAAMMAAARDGAPLPVPPSPPADVLQNIGAVAVATICDDVRWPDSVPAYAADVARNRVRYPLTDGMPVNIGPCSYWPAPAEPPVRVTSRGPSNVLLVQNLRDPATPFSGALEMRRAFGDRARMVAVDSGGHGSYRDTGNACGDDLVTRFLVTGERPAHDVLCPKGP